MRKILTFMILLAAVCRGYAQERTAQNKPYIDLRPLHFGILVGMHMQDIEMENVGPQTITGADGTVTEQTILCDADNWNPDSVSVLRPKRVSAPIFRPV